MRVLFLPFPQCHEPGSQCGMQPDDLPPRILEPGSIGWCTVASADLPDTPDYVQSGILCVCAKHLLLDSRATVRFLNRAKVVTGSGRNGFLNNGHQVRYEWT